MGTIFGTVLLVTKYVSYALKCMQNLWRTCGIQIYALKAHIHYTLPIEISTIPFHFIIGYIAGERS